METKEVMLDDITFENCGQEDVPGGSEHLTCNFERDTCSWYHDYTASLLWDRNDGKYEDVTGNGKTVLQNPVTAAVCSATLTRVFLKATSCG